MVLIAAWLRAAGPSQGLAPLAREGLALRHGRRHFARSAKWRYALASEERALRDDADRTRSATPGVVRDRPEK